MGGMARKAPKPTKAKARTLAVSPILKRVLQAAHALPSLKRLAPAPQWEVMVELVGERVMKKLNSHYRDKSYATDVLSFQAPSVFRTQGLLGELLICKSVLMRQAREHGHSAQIELEVLIVHGILHLLGFDHEKSPKQAREMEKWEAKLLGSKARHRGLIQRSRSGNT
jgi:rRNA maturation RNase YbeY